MKNDPTPSVMFSMSRLLGAATGGEFFTHLLLSHISLWQSFFSFFFLVFLLFSFFNFYFLLILVEFERAYKQGKENCCLILHNNTMWTWSGQTFFLKGYSKVNGQVVFAQSKGFQNKLPGVNITSSGLFARQARPISKTPILGRASRINFTFLALGKLKLAL